MGRQDTTVAIEVMRHFEDRIEARQTDAPLGGDHPFPPGMDALAVEHMVGPDEEQSREPPKEALETPAAMPKSHSRTSIGECNHAIPLVVVLEEEPLEGTSGGRRGPRDVVD